MTDSELGTNRSYSSLIGLLLENLGSLAKILASYFEQVSSSTSGASFFTLLLSMGLAGLVNE